MIYYVKNEIERIVKHGVTELMFRDILSHARITGSISEFKQCDDFGKFQELFEYSRKHGIDDSVYPYAYGGSTVSAINGINSMKSPLDVFKEMRGLPTPESKNKEALFRGHKMESVYMDYFVWSTKKNAFPCDLQFNSIKYPHLLVNLDGLIIEDGKLGVFEVKSTSNFNRSMIDKWKDGEIPETYNMQIQAYMQCLGLEFAYIVLGWSNEPKDIAYVKIFRDAELANRILTNCEEFVRDTVKGILPKVSSVKSSDRQAQEISKALYGEGDPKLPSVSFSPQAKENIKKLLELDKERKALEKKCRELQKKRVIFYAPVLDEMKASEDALCNINGAEYFISYKPSERKTIDMDLLKREYPEVYSNVLKKSSNRNFSLKRKKGADHIGDKMSPCMDSL